MVVAEVGDLGDKQGIEPLDEPVPGPTECVGENVRLGVSYGIELLELADAGDIQRDGGSPTAERSVGYACPEV